MWTRVIYTIIIPSDTNLGFIPLGINCGGGNFDGDYGCVAIGGHSMHKKVWRSKVLSNIVRYLSGYQSC